MTAPPKLGAIEAVSIWKQYLTTVAIIVVTRATMSKRWHSHQVGWIVATTA